MKFSDYIKGTLIFCGVIIIWGLTFFLPFQLGFSESGQFGDMFGSVNALFSGLGLAAIVWTIYLQIAGMSEQRRQDRLNTALRLIDEVKGDLSAFKLGESQGTEAIMELMRIVARKEWMELETTDNTQAVTLLFGSVALLSNVLQYSNKYLESEPEIGIVKERVSVIVVSYLLRLRNILNINEANEGQALLLKEELNKIVNQVFPGV